MANLLLLYDTLEKDLARDVEELLSELNIGTVIKIATSPDKGLSLEDKENYYIERADGIVFLITPGSERLGNLYPSPSVSEEIGRTKGEEKFKQNRGLVNYFVDTRCNMAAIHQKAYIQFRRDDARSVISAITQLVKNLKDAGLFTVPTTARFNNVTHQTLFENLDEKIKQVAFYMSNQRESVTNDLDIEKMLMVKYGQITIQDINFIKRDLQLNGIASRIVGEKLDIWFLTPLGWEIARLDRDQRRKSAQEQAAAFLKMIGSLSKK